VAERRLHGRLRHGAEDVHEAQREAAILDRVGCRLGGRADLAGHPLHERRDCFGRVHTLWDGQRRVDHDHQQRVYIRRRGLLARRAKEVDMLGHGGGRHRCASVRSFHLRQLLFWEEVEAAEFGHDALLLLLRAGLGLGLGAGVRQSRCDLVQVPRARRGFSVQRRLLVAWACI
jgi:hypothetical protein